MDTTHPENRWLTKSRWPLRQSPRFDVGDDLVVEARGGFSAEVVMFCSWSDIVFLFVDSNSSKSSE